MIGMSSKTKPVSKPVVPPVRIGKKKEVSLAKEVIEKKAYEIASKRLGYDDCVWQWAELELKVGSAIVNQPIGSAGMAIVDPSKIVSKPAASDIKKLASEYAARKTKVETIHWYIAERQYILDQLRG